MDWFPLYNSIRIAAISTVIIFFVGIYAAYYIAKTPRLVKGVLDVDSGREKLSGKVVVCGGGLSGMESALALAMEGCSVTVVDMKPEKEFAADASPCLRGMLLKLIDDYKVELVGDHIVREINEEGVLAEGRDWRYRMLEADYVVNAMGMKPNPAAEVFRELTPYVYFVGDCDKVGNVLTANLTAYDRSCNI